MRYHELLTETVHIDSPQFRSWFRQSKVVDAAGNPLPVYHGTGRPDRVGTVFRRSRATAGPMAYFTEDPKVASSYAETKADTSLDNDEIENEHYYDSWFMVKIPGQRSPVDIVRSWYLLSRDQQQVIKQLAPRVHSTDQGEIVLGDENHTNGVGNLDYALQQARGNYIQALIDGWLAGAVLSGEEREFLTVLKLVGYPYRVEFKHPDETFPTVYSVFLSIQNPLYTQNIPQPVMDALTKAAGRTSNRNKFDLGQWDKKSSDANDWLRGLLNDIEQATNFHWTVIPDWVTKTLQGLGYDGICDQGGKHNPDHHTVWVPFTETQVKSAISNKNFDPTKRNIHK